MNSYKCSFSLLVLILFMVSCENTKRELPNSTFNIIKNVSKEDLLTEVASIKLELNKNSIVSFPFDLCIVNKKFIISSRDNTIKVFNDQGQYITQVGSIGEGPGEYHLPLQTRGRPGDRGQG